MEKVDLDKHIGQIFLDYNTDETICTEKIKNLIYKLLEDILFELEQISRKRGLQKNMFETGRTSGMNQMLFHLRQEIEAIK